MARLSAFAGCPPIAAAGLHVQPVEPLAAVSVTAWPGQAAPLEAALRGLGGPALPQAGRWTEANGLVAVWLGPQHYGLQREGEAPLLPELTPLAAYATLIDLTDARAVLRVSGPASRGILARLLPLDLHPRAFAPGHAATTSGAHLTVQLRQRDAAPSYELSVGRSFAGSLWRALAMAGAERP